MADCKTKDILNIAFSKGKIHDFKLFKNTFSEINKDILILADKAYKGIFDIHFNSLIPVKASKNHKLTYEEKLFNRSLAKRRIFIEHINRYIKRFRILSSRYRNKLRRFALRASIVCGIYNFQHCL